MALTDATLPAGIPFTPGHVNTPSSGGTEVDVSAAPSWTTTFTAGTNLDRQAGAALNGTASFTAATSLERQLGGALNVGATFTADANLDRQATASPTWAATFTASMTVVQPGLVTAGAALNVTASFTAQATLDGRAGKGLGGVVIGSAKTGVVINPVSPPSKTRVVINKHVAGVTIGSQNG